MREEKKAANLSYHFPTVPVCPRCQHRAKSHRHTAGTRGLGDEGAGGRGGGASTLMPAEIQTQSKVKQFDELTGEHRKAHSSDWFYAPTFLRLPARNFTSYMRLKRNLVVYCLIKRKKRRGEKDQRSLLPLVTLCSYYS